MTGLEVRNLTCGYEGKPVIEHIDCAVRPGEVLCVLGPNGVGKTTFFKTLLGALPRIGGEILWNGVSVNWRHNRTRARLIAYVPQTHSPPFPYRVREVVVMGRAAHIKPLQSPVRADYEICDTILEKLQLSYLRDKIYTQISGGERQMVLIARALAQQPLLLMMDEPTANLDYGNQMRVLQLALTLAAEGLMILMTTHSPDHAALCAAKVALFQKDRPFLLGSPEQILTEDNLRSAYGVCVKMFSYKNKQDKEIKVCAPLLE
jgi:iron complex transport system ATP-binding protein